MKRILLITVSALLLAGCSATKNAATRAQTYGQMYEEKPVSILVMPPINKSVKVEAKEIFYSALAAPMSMYGYYVFPPILTMDILKEESAYDSEMFIDNSLKSVGEAFGADAVLFTIIHEWKKTTIASRLDVKIQYILKSTKTDAILFDRTGDITVNMNANYGGGLLGSLAAGIISTAFTKEVVGGRACNYYTLSDLPRGKYSTSFQMDGDVAAKPKEFQITVNLQNIPNQ